MTEMLVDAPKSGGFGQRVLNAVTQRKVLPMQQHELQQQSEGGDMNGQPSIQQTKGGVLVFIPNVLLVGIVLFLLGSPVASGLLWGGASNAENAKLSKTLEAIAEHLDELDARMTRLERAAKAAKETKQ